jgi:hypothetical protein
VNRSGGIDRAKAALNIQQRGRPRLFEQVNSTIPAKDQYPAVRRARQSALGRGMAVEKNESAPLVGIRTVNDGAALKPLGSN